MAMDKSAADAFVYAKASGMMARSYIGKRARQLFSFHTLQELWAFLFKKEVPVVPETLLAKALENEAFSRFLSEYEGLVGNYARPEQILLTLLHNFDYENLKDIGASLILNEKKMPQVHEITPFNIIRYEKWPDIAAVTADGPLAWYNSVPAVTEQHLVNYKLDCQYIRELWSAAKSIRSPCREAILDLLGEKLRIDNIVWAIRLRLYYSMSREEAQPLLAYTDEKKSASDDLASDAVQTLGWELDSFEQWKKWKFSYLLNPHEEGAVWNVDPRWIANSYKSEYVRKAYKLFHKYPFTVCPLVCWFVIKRNELDYIRTASESLRLSISSSQAMQMAGIPEVMHG
ncbi:MAG: V-type ATPase subunit [Treponema sp.]|nr:V-type ATPase subunit [Treponema sp.]